MLVNSISPLPKLSKLKNREEFEGGLHEKREGKGGKEEKSKDKRKKGKKVKRGWRHKNGIF